ncbi:hypothetical protein C8D92_108185 [Tamilnaduibacter salinus]|uniref:Lipopolysaccharide biosynthesis protein n=1 Tax=Tamilnaduibacter salinus TaxID=1484056 RepID=A0A2A2I019_9GAMM|nr:hypothetical protein [Tamilnaduibacter salinus]PAV24997.1 hypothetical protein CF392_13330 [Tamilnaduibacter salinus]PVY70828.1 hypothetical protein C8D92_108185 [Tamilnaduibacter salinus]
MNHTSSAGSANGRLTPVDIGVIFVRRIRIFIVGFLMIFGLACVFAFWGERSYEYTSMYRLGKAGPDTYLESPDMVVASAKSDWVPQAAKSIEGRIPNIRVSVSKSGEVVFLRSKETEERESSVEELHRFLLSRLIREQKQMFAAREAQLKQELTVIRRLLNQIGESGGSAANQLRAQEMDVRRQLAGLKKGSEMAEAVRSIKPVGLSWLHVIVLGMILAVMGGAVAAFIGEYIARVRSTITSAQTV